MPQRRERVITGSQVRMARAALRISAAELARGSGLSERTIWRIEQTDGIPAKATVESVERLRSYLESRGITFLPEDFETRNGGPGIRYRT